MCVLVCVSVCACVSVCVFYSAIVKPVILKPIEILSDFRKTRAPAIVRRDTAA